VLRPAGAGVEQPGGGAVRGGAPGHSPGPPYTSSSGHSRLACGSCGCDPGFSTG